MKRGYEEYLFKRIFLILAVLVSVFIVSASTIKVGEKLTTTSRNTEYKASKMIEEIDNKYTVITNWIIGIKAESEFVSYILNEEIDYYNLSKLHRIIEKYQVSLSGAEYFLGIIKDSREAPILTHRGTDSREFFLRRNKIGVSPEKIEENIKNLSSGESRYIETGNKIIYLLRDSIISSDEKFTWIVVAEKNKFFDIFKRDIDGRWERGGSKAPKGNLVYKNKVFGEEITFVKDNIEKEVYMTYLVIYYILPLLIAVTLIYIMSKKVSTCLYDPVNNFVGDLSKMGSGEGFEHIKNIYLNLKNQNIFLEEKVLNLNNIIEKKERKSYLMGSSNSERVSMNKKVVVSVLRSIQGESYDEIYSKELLITAKTKLEIFLEKAGNNEFIEMDHSNIVVISESIPRDDIRNRIEAILEEMNKEFSIVYSAIVMKEGSYKEAPKTYKRAIRILDYDGVNSGRVVLEESAVINKGGNYSYPLSIESKILNKVLNGNTNGLEEIIEDIFTENYEERKLGKDEKRELRILLLNTVKRIVNQLKLKGEGVGLTYSDIGKLEGIGNYKKFKEKYIECIKGTIKAEKGDELLKGSLTSYIEDNYNQDITLETLAGHMGYSVKYTSFLFKKLLGENFKNRLTTQRIEKAKELLANNPEMLIKEVAGLSGFNSDNAFIRTFKRVEGISPGKFVSKNKI